MGIKVIETERSWRIREPRPYKTRPNDPDSPVSYHENYVPRDGRWTFNGNFERPTFSPSVNESYGGVDDGSNIPFSRNHYIVTDGMIQYCGDSTHEFAGQILELMDFSDAVIEMEKARREEAQQ